MTGLEPRSPTSVRGKRARRRPTAVDVSRFGTTGPHRDRAQRVAMSDNSAQKLNLQMLDLWHDRCTTHRPTHPRISPVAVRLMGAKKTVEARGSEGRGTSREDQQ